MKKYLFWLAFIPMCILMLILAISAGVLEILDQAYCKLIYRFEYWCFGREDDGR